jgi:hypothetical protein
MIDPAQVRGVLEAQVPGARAWLDLTRPGHFAVSFGAAARHLGRAALDPTPQLGPMRWCADELGRALLLLELPPDERFERAQTAFYLGDSRERQAVLKGLPLFGAPEPWVPLAAEGCRLNVVPVFEAIACENPFPGQHFSDAQFNQMALKAVFLGVSVQRIIGLERRKSSDLARMARDYAAERTAAGRPVPDDVQRLLL